MRAIARAVPRARPPRADRLPAARRAIARRGAVASLLPMSFQSVGLNRSAIAVRAFFNPSALSDEI